MTVKANLAYLGKIAERRGELRFDFTEIKAG